MQSVLMVKKAAADRSKELTMMETNRDRRNNRKKNRKKVIGITGAVLIITAVIAGVSTLLFLNRGPDLPTPDELLIQYMNHISAQEYEEMYAMIDSDASGSISMEEFTQRNQAIYEGIEVQNMTTEVLEYDKETGVVTYQTSFDTVAGNISFENRVLFIEGETKEEGHKIVWNDSLIFPGLNASDKVKVSHTAAKRGEIRDRNGNLLAGDQTASSVGIVPGKLENKEEAIQAIAELLQITPESIEKKLSAKWVQDDYFVPIQTVPKVEVLESMTWKEEEEIAEEKERQEQLLTIPGVMISDTTVRGYPLGEAAAHLIGYVQNVTAEDLENHAGEGYAVDSVIGRSGMESLFEKELKGTNGCRIYILDGEGNEKEELVCIPVQDGANIQLTIDTSLQTSIYEQFKEDKSCSVSIDPYTGEVLALVSTPSYDNNAFIMGLSTEKWNAMNEDENMPMYNRFRQVWCPGSSLKPVIAAIGLESGAIDPNEDYGSEGLSWQQDSSWGSYYVTTLHTYEPVILENALIYSDNIYFAKAALKIGAQELGEAFTELGFKETLPFEIVMQKSQYSNTENIETQIQLADSGYGQGEILVNPLHLACIYSAFCNEGNMIQPYLVCKEDRNAEYLYSGVFSKETADKVLEGIKKVVNDPNGTGYEAHMDNVVLAGKTGTAEIKTSKEDTTGTELGWFAVFTAEKTSSRPVMVVTMVEDVKGRGGSGYVVGKDKLVLENWFSLH